MDHLIYHPTRKIEVIGNTTVYHDEFGGNEDPFLWNDKFLHTSCHITQLQNEVGQINFWVSGDHYPDFTELYCDCVFVIAEKLTWKRRNAIDDDDNIIDNKQSFEHHYSWVNQLSPVDHHYFKKRNRYTLKADPDKSFQPQLKNHRLIDVAGFLAKQGMSIDRLRKGMTSRVYSRPFKLPDGLGQKLYAFLYAKAVIKLRGSQIAPLYPKGIDNNSDRHSNKCC
jgi:hypothetical protein